VILLYPQTNRTVITPYPQTNRTGSLYSDESADYSSGYSDDGGSLITPADSIADLEMPSLDGFSIESEDEVSFLLTEELRIPS
jgi:hypothetical protein